MIKKKLNILLLLSLALLFIGSFSTSYAKELTDNDIKNFIYNYAIFNGRTEEQAKSIVESFSNLPNANDSTQLEIDRWKNIANNLYEGQYILWASNNSIGIWRYGGSENNLKLYGPYFYNGRISVNTSYLYTWNTIYSLASPNNTTKTYDQGSSFITFPTNVNDYFFYTDTNVYNNSVIANTTIKYNAGYMKPNNLFSGYYTDDYFSFLLNSSLPTMTINNNEVPYYNLQTNQADSFVLGQLGLAKNFSFAELDSYRYQNGDWKHVGTNTLYNIGTTTNDLISVTISGSIVNSNTLYTLTMYSAYDSDFPNISQPFYITDRNTIITNGALNTEDTFSGDYFNNYNNDTNTDKIINNDNNLYDKMFKVSGDKIDEIFTNAMESIEIESGELAEFEIIKNYLQGEPRRFYNIVAVHIRQTLRYKGNQ